MADIMKWMMDNKILTAIFVILILAMSGQCGTLKMAVTGDGSGAGGGSGGGGGGGGGGGSGGGSPAAPPEGGFICDTCDSSFFEGNPGVVTAKFEGPGFQHFFNPPEGHWNCEGPCVYNGVTYDDYFCVPDPLAEIPEDGFDNIIGQRPDCLCLPPNPGPCAFYDAGYGQQELDNWQCGGSCPEGMACVSWGGPSNNKFCRCKESLSDVDKDCGFHVDEGESYGDVENLAQWCYGYCPQQNLCDVGLNIFGGDVPNNGDGVNDCVFFMDSDDEPQCECEEDCEPQEPPNCKDIDPTGDPLSCLKGRCDAGDECTYDQKKQACKCQGTKDCGWHISYEEAQKLIEKFGPQGAAFHVFENNENYCYGGCENQGDVCTFSIYEFFGRPIYDCRCEVDVYDGDGPNGDGYQNGDGYDESEDQNGDGPDYGESEACQARCEEGGFDWGDTAGVEFPVSMTCWTHSANSCSDGQWNGDRETWFNWVSDYSDPTNNGDQCCCYTCEEPTKLGLFRVVK